MTYLDDWLRRQFYSNYQPETPAQFGQEALAPLGGVDPRAMENGAANFSDPTEAAKLFGAKAIGAFADPKTMGLLGMGLLSASQPQPVRYLEAGPRPPSAPVESPEQVLARLREIYKMKKKRQPDSEA